MRILVFGKADSPNLMAWLEQLHNAGADVHIASFEAWSCEFGTAHPLGRRRGLVAYALAGLRGRWLRRRLRPDVVIGYYVGGYGLAAWLTGHRLTVQVPVGTDVFLSMRQPVRGALIRRLLRRADLVLCIGHTIRAECAGVGVQPDRLLTLPHGVDLDRFPLTERAPKPSVIVASTRSLEPYYRVAEVIRGVEKTRRAGVEASLLIAGSGSEEPRLRELVHTLRLDEYVEMLGAVTWTEVPHVLRQADVYCSACPTDGVSASLIEAMAAGCFPIVIDNAANREWLTAGTADLIGEPVAELIARRLIELSSDRERLLRAVTENRATVEQRCDAKTNAHTLIDVLHARLPQRAATSDGDERGQ